MEQSLYKFIPDGWTKSASNQPRRIMLSRNSTEYDEIEKLIKHSGKRIRQIERYEDPIKYVQFLVRQQHLCAIEPTKTFYKIRQFLTLSEGDVDGAINVHLDKRRMRVLENHPFRSALTYCYEDAVLIVSVVTDSIYGDFVPKRDSEYYVEYIVYFD